MAASRSPVSDYQYCTLLLIITDLILLKSLWILNRIQRKAASGSAAWAQWAAVPLARCIISPERTSTMQCVMTVGRVPPTTEDYHCVTKIMRSFSPISLHPSVRSCTAANAVAKMVADDPMTPFQLWPSAPGWCFPINARAQRNTSTCMHVPFACSRSVRHCTRSKCTHR
jgi:hypothetical protein